MNYLIGIEFWKRLFDHLKTNSQATLPYFSIYYRKRPHVFYLDHFQPTDPAILPTPTSSASDHNSNSGDQTGLMVINTSNAIVNPIDLLKEYQGTGGQLTPGQLFLVVEPKFERFRAFHQLFLYQGSPESGVLVPEQVQTPTLKALTERVEVDLRNSIESNSLLEHAGKNNLKLMKIRLAPELDLERLYQLRVTILGTGTLGCNIARDLLSWGVEHLTFVDNNTVSSSNLLRQSLFESGDLGQPKAIAAAKRVTAIFPPSQGKVTGVEISIPMPDHPECLPNLRENVDKLERVIEQTDVVFLCTDNRESRWLPSLIAVVKNKPLINVAIGFDSWTVMRHPLEAPVPSTEIFSKLMVPSSVTSPDGLSQFDSSPKKGAGQSLSGGNGTLLCPTAVNRETVGQSITSLGGVCLGGREIGSSYGSLSDDQIGSDKLEVDLFGCYFCPSVEGIRNTVQHQEEDERCTVTRGGASSLASACAVELVVSLLNGKRGFSASAGPEGTWTLENSLIKGEHPQQLRGNLSDFSLDRYLVRRNANCVCCSSTILDFYRDSMTRTKFLESVCRDSSYLVSLVGEPAPADLADYEGDLAFPLNPLAQGDLAFPLNHLAQGDQRALGPFHSPLNPLAPSTWFKRDRGTSRSKLT